METNQHNVSIELKRKCIACLSEKGCFEAFNNDILNVYEELIDEQITDKLDKSLTIFCTKCKNLLQDFKLFKDTCKKSWMTIAETLSKEWACELEQLLSDSPTISKSICWKSIGFNQDDIFLVESDSEASTISLIGTNECTNILKEPDSSLVLECNESKFENQLEQAGSNVEITPVVPVVQCVEKHKSPSPIEFNGNTESSTILDIKPQTSLPISRKRRGSCSVCHKITNNLESHYLREHTSISSDGKYICSFCTRMVDTKKMIITHIKVCHSKYPEPRQCHHCERTFTVSGEYLSHLRKHQRENRKHTCNICGKVEDKASRLHSHIMRIHNGSLYCKFCYKPFTEQVELEAHLEKERARREKKFEYVCDFCGYKTKSKQQLVKHISKLHDKSKLDKFDCFTCSKTFTDKQNLTHHIKIMHDKNHQCTECNESFGFPKDLRNHIQKRHTLEGMKTTCELCGKVISKQALTMHKKIMHTNIKPFTCNVCDKAFKKKSMLKIHYYKHTGFRPYFCYICNQGFYDSPVLQKHFEREHSKVVTHQEIKQDCKRNPPSTYAI